MGRPKTNVLVVDDDEAIRESIRRSLESSGCTVAEAASAREANACLQESPCHVVVLDFSLPGTDGMEFLKQTRAIYPNTEFIMVTAYGSVDKAVEAMRNGAFDFVEKPFDLDKLVMLVQKAVRFSSLERENVVLRAATARARDAEEIITQDPAMIRTVNMAKTVAPASAPALLLGETGTGKELLARLIHGHSSVREGVFLPLNCTAMQPSLFESELFGYEKGAFTGATASKIGLLEAASGGTLLLDEIGDMSTEVQGKLLRVLETGELRRVGGTQLRHTEARIIAATNRNMLKAVKDGRFRQDLYFRLNTLTIDIPPLRDRKGDIPLLAEHFMKRSSARYGKKVTGIDAAAMDALERHRWPGNVRELWHVIDRAVLLCVSDAITVDNLSCTESEPASSHNVFDRSLPLDEVERLYILHILERNRGHREKTASALGISIRTLRRRLADYGLADEESEA